MTEPDENAELGLVMPFVVCETNGGVYQDCAFVAGATFGMLNERLASTFEDVVEHYVPPELVPQLDLAAMHHGWTLESEPWDEHPDEWTRVTFTRQLA